MPEPSHPESIQDKSERAMIFCRYCLQKDIDAFCFFLRKKSFEDVQQIIQGICSLHRAVFGAVALSDSASIEEKRVTIYLVVDEMLVSKVEKYLRNAEFTESRAFSLSQELVPQRAPHPRDTASWN